MEAELTSWIGAFSYPAVILLLLACGVGAPLSEDVILVTGGLLASQGRALLPGMMLAGWIGVVGGDLVLFHVGRALGPRLEQHRRLGPLIRGPRAAAIRERLARRGWTTVVGARFIPGFRLPTFLLAGAVGIPRRQFLLADGAAAMITAPLLVFLGYRFGTGILSDIGRGGHYLFAIVILLLLLLAAVWGVRRTLRIAALRRGRV